MRKILFDINSIEKSMTSPKATIFDEFISYSQQASGNNIPRELRKMTSENESTVNSILEGVELKYYPDAFYFPEIDTLLIRTKDDMDLVLSHIESVVFEFFKQNKIPQNNYIMHDFSEIIEIIKKII